MNIIPFEKSFAYCKNQNIGVKNELTLSQVYKHSGNK